MDPVTAIDTSIKLVRRLREISKNIAEAEFRNVLADLANELADAKFEIVNLKGQVAEAMQEVHLLKQAAPESKPKPKAVRHGCYEFEGEEGLFCSACYDTKGQRIRVTRLDSRFRKCPVCDALLGG